MMTQRRYKLVKKGQLTAWIEMRSQKSGVTKRKQDEREEGRGETKRSPPGTQII